MDPEISRRIEFLRYSMIFGIVILHTPPYVPLAETGSTFFDFSKAFFQHAFFRASVPVLTAISGYLLFAHSLDLNFRLLLTKKTRTLLIPLILFNLPLVIALYFFQQSFPIKHEFSVQLHPFELSVWLNAIVGLNGTPINYPLNFLRDLYVLALMAPIFGFLIRRYPWIGLIGIFTLFWFDFDGLIIRRNTMPIVFYLGGLAAVYRWDLKALDRYAVPLFAVFVALCVSIVYFDIENRNYLRVVSPVLIWPAVSLVVGTRFGLWVAGKSRYSFFTFLMRAPLLLAFWLFYKKVSTFVPYWSFWLVTPVFSAIVLSYLYTMLRGRYPRIMQFALGSR